MRKVVNDEVRKKHILNNHQPFRRDCALCLRNGGVGRQHRALESKDICDVAGPLRKKGRSPDGKESRYFFLGPIATQSSIVSVKQGMRFRMKLQKRSLQSRTTLCRSSTRWLTS